MPWRGSVRSCEEADIPDAMTQSGHASEIVPSSLLIWISIDLDSCFLESIRQTGLRRRTLMPGDPKECRRQAYECVRALLKEARTRKAREEFSALANTWLRLAVIFEQEVERRAQPVWRQQMECYPAQFTSASAYKAESLLVLPRWTPVDHMHPSALFPARDRCRWLRPSVPFDP